MKMFEIPVVKKRVVVYVGPDEWDRNLKTVVRHGAPLHGDELGKPPDSPGDGRSYGSWIWLREWGQGVTLFHELSHFMDDLMAMIGSRDSEFRAYISGWLYPRVTAWYAVESLGHDG